MTIPRRSFLPAAALLTLGGAAAAHADGLNNPENGLNNPPFIPAEPKYLERDGGAVPYDPANPFDNWERISTALSSGGVWSGAGKTYAVSGNVVPTQVGTKPVGLTACQLVQLDPLAAGRVTLTWQNITNLYDRNVTVQRHLNGVDCTTMANTGARGILYQSCANVYSERAECYGDGPGVLILWADCDDFTIINPYVHDAMWAQATDPGFEQIVGLRINRCGFGRIYSPRGENMVGKIGSARVGPYQTTVMVGTACDDAIAYGVNLANGTVGIDLSGSEPSFTRGFKVIGGTARNCSVFGFKMTHGSKGDLFLGLTARDCGVAGFVILLGQGAAHNSYGSADSCLAYSTGTLVSRPLNPVDPELITPAVGTSGMHIVGGPKGFTARDFKAIASVDNVLYSPNRIVWPENVTTWLGKGYIAADNPWGTGAAYVAGTVVTQWAAYFKCKTNHTSGNFRDDLDAGLWTRGVSTPNILAPTWPTGANPPVHTTGTVTDAAGIPWTYMGLCIASIAGSGGTGYGRPQVTGAVPDLPGGRVAGINPITDINGVITGYTLQYRGFGFTTPPTLAVVDYATGTITLTGLPANGNTLTLGGTVITFVTAIPSGNQVQIGGDQFTTYFNLFNFLRFSADANISQCNYISAANRVDIIVTAAASGVGGQSFTMAKSGNNNYAISGAALTGGGGTGAAPVATLSATSDVSAQLMANGVLLEGVVTAGDVGIFDPQSDGHWNVDFSDTSNTGGNINLSPITSKMTTGAFLSSPGQQSSLISPRAIWQTPFINKQASVFPRSSFIAVNGLNHDLVLPNATTITFGNGPTADMTIDSFARTTVNALTYDEQEALIEVTLPTLNVTLVDQLRATNPNGNSTNRIRMPGAVQAKGFFNFTGVPTAGVDSITLNSTVFSFVAGAPSGNQIQVGADANGTAANVVTALQASTDANALLCTYAQNGSQVNITYKTVSGLFGNAFTLAKSGANISVSGATLTGGGSPDFTFPAGRRGGSFRLHYSGESNVWSVSSLNVY